MCNCNNICLLKLKFANYVNDNMLKETNMALELLRNINCDNLEEVKNKLINIVGGEIIEDEVIVSSIVLSSSSKTCIVTKEEIETCKSYENTNEKINCFDTLKKNYKKCVQTALPTNMSSDIILVRNN
jgi:hypothetical protein